MAADTGHNWSVLKTALDDELVEQGLAVIVRGFGRGKKGLVRIDPLVYERLVVPSKEQRRGRETLASEAETAGPRSSDTAGSSDPRIPAEIQQSSSRVPAEIQQGSPDGAGSSCLENDLAVKGLVGKGLKGSRTHARVRDSDVEPSEVPRHDASDDAAPPDDGTAPPPGDADDHDAPDDDAAALRLSAAMSETADDDRARTP